MLRWAILALAGTLALSAGAGGVGPQARNGVSDPATRAVVEADWAAELDPAAPPSGPAAAKTQEDAAGGNDGVINGGYGFHCASGAPNSWWQVDLGKPYALDRVVVYNRCGGTEMRAAKALVVLASNDGRTWDLAYQHDGSFFGGHPDKRPLVVRFAERPVSARFVRLQARAAVSFHLDEVEVYPRDDPRKNIALGRPADQSSLSAFSVRHARPGAEQASRPSRPLRPLMSTAPDAGKALAEGRRLLDQMAKLGAGERLTRLGERLKAVEARLTELKAKAEGNPETWRALWLDARWAVRDVALANPLLGFDTLVFVKRHPGLFAHMCDQYYGCLARPGGGLFLLENLGGNFTARDLAGSRLPAGSFLSADLSYDARQIVFAYTRGAGAPKQRWAWSPEVSYHLYLINADGTGLKALTDGPYDDLHPRWLPDGGIAFISTRRGGYCRCGARPVPTYTLYRIQPDGTGLARLSAHETNEWHPCVLNDGRLVYTRWDYVDRHTNLAHSLWTTLPDGSNPAVLFGNYNFLKKPWGLWHPEAVPGSNKVLAIAGAHHGYAEGSLVLINPRKGQDGLEPLERLTPHVPFPEAEGWPTQNYASATPLSEDYFLVSYSPNWSARANLFKVPLGLYLQDRWGHRELIYRDAAIASMCPIPLRPRPRPAVRPLPTPLVGEAPCSSDPEPRKPNTEHRQPPRVPYQQGPAQAQPEPATDGAMGRFLVLDAYRSTEPIPRGTLKTLRIIQILPKTTYVADVPRISMARQVSARYLLGTVPVEPDGSAYFEAPAGVPLYFQAVDADGMAVQGMRSIVYVQPGETLSCVGCHEPRSSTPPNASPLAAMRAPSAIAPGPDGSMPFSYPRLVQPVLDKHCVRCHGNAKADGGIRLTGAYTKASGEHSESYRTLATRKLVHWFDSINGGEWVPRTYPGKFGARASRLVELLRKGHYDAKLSPDELGRVCLWIDLNVPFYGVYEPSLAAEQRRGAVVPLAAIMK